jgi:hypothetical protein
MNPHERITHIGGISPNGERWRTAQQEAIDGIESGKCGSGDFMFVLATGM